MAAPAIYTISRKTGPLTGGTVFEIFGVNFRLPSPPPASGPVPPRPQTVEVFVGNSLCPSASVASGTRIIASTPPGSSSALLDVTVRNIDDAGVPISGEQATLSGVFQYIRPPLLEESPLTHLVRQFVLELRRQTIPEVVHRWSSDYYDRAMSLTQLRLAKLPALVLIGPRMPQNRFYSINQRCEEEDIETNSFVVKQPPLTVDLQFSLLGFAEKSVQNLNLSYLFQVFMQKNRYLTLQRNLASPADGSVSYEMEWSPFESTVDVVSRPNESNVSAFSAELVVRGFDVDGYAGIQNDSVLSFGEGIDEILLDVAAKTS